MGNKLSAFISTSSSESLLCWARYMPVRGRSAGGPNGSTCCLTASKLRVFIKDRMYMLGQSTYLSRNSHSAGTDYRSAPMNDSLRFRYFPANVLHLMV